jgi:phage terminase large subunit-like protein
MVRASPALARRLKINDYRKRIVWPAGNGSIRANSADAPNKDGLNPSLIINDELHRQGQDYRLWDIFEFASAARSQALRISITTAGEEEAGPWFDERDRSEKINAGIIPDTTHLGIVYRCDPADDLDDPEVWRKANPSLGVTIDPEKFAREYEKAKRNPREFAGFKRLRFNIVTKSDSVFIPVERWDACKADPPTDWSALRGATVWIGADLSSVTDLTAAVLIAGDSEAGFDVAAHFWLPEDNILKLQETDRVPYLLWAEQGFLTLTSGCTVDYFSVRRWINARAGREWEPETKEFRNEEPPKGDSFQVERLAFDPWNANDLAHALADADGFRVEYTRQGGFSANAPTKELERLTLARLIRHDGHPVLRWNISNAIAVTDAHSNVKLDKRKSRQKIDGAAALVNALAAAMTGGASSRSVYDTRDVLTF